MTRSGFTLGRPAAALCLALLAACREGPTTVSTEAGRLAAAETFSHHAGGKGASAEFSMIDGLGVQTDVVISAHEGFRPAGGGAAGPRETQTSMGIQVRQFDSACPPSVAGCPRAAPDLLTVGHLELDRSSFSMPAISSGASARLRAQIVVLDRSSDSPVDLSIDLTWTCTGKVEHTNRHHAVTLPAGEEVDVLSVQFTRCDASASGNVSDGVTNFVQGPSARAFLIADNLIEVEVRRGG